MSRKTKLRLASLILLLIALIFPFRSAAEQRRVFYRLYAAVTAGLFLLSFLPQKRKPKAP